MHTLKSKGEATKMIRPRFLGCISCLLVISLFSPAHGRELVLDRVELKCEGGTYLLRFAVINRFTFDQQPTVAIKMIDGGRVLACRAVALQVPGGADGSVIQEVPFDLECTEEPLVYEIKIFERRRRNRVNIWLSDCPQFR
jgi:hypothetical protein